MFFFSLSFCLCSFCVVAFRCRLVSLCDSRDTCAIGRLLPLHFQMRWSSTISCLFFLRFSLFFSFVAVSTTDDRKMFHFEPNHSVHERTTERLIYMCINGYVDGCKIRFEFSKTFPLFMRHFVRFWSLVVAAFYRWSS